MCFEGVPVHPYISGPGQLALRGGSHRGPVEWPRTARTAPTSCTPIGAYALVLVLEGVQHRIEKEREGEKLKLLGLEDIQKRGKAALCRLER